MKLMEHATLTERVKNLEQQLAEATKVIEKLRAARVVSDEELRQVFNKYLCGYYPDPGEWSAFRAGYLAGEKRLSESEDT
jgi:hypothetical protein